MSRRPIASRRLGRRRLLAVALCALALSGCKDSYSVGDEVLVEWEGNVYPATILEVTGARKYKIHYQGYDESWDEAVGPERIKGLVEGDVVHPEPPAKVRAKALKAAGSNKFQIGDAVRVEWHGDLYNASVIGVAGHERYRVHYEGYGSEWDETVAGSRIQPRQ